MDIKNLKLKNPIKELNYFLTFEIILWIDKKACTV